MTADSHADEQDMERDEAQGLDPTPLIDGPRNDANRRSGESATEANRPASDSSVVRLDDIGNSEVSRLSWTPLPRRSLAQRTIAGYTILEELGRGGMGVVYTARQVSLKRRVALKVLLAGGHARPEQLDRFWAEAEALAQLQHPNIVQIYEVGEHDGLPFFSMELVEGRSLAQEISRSPFPPRQAARVIEAVARGVQAAHQRGLVHRDLKPANILLARDGTPKITDFGLVKNLAADAHCTRSGAILGTPSYMAPEQAQRGNEVGPPADVYSLGAVLYEMLTGRPPFQGNSPVDVLLEVRSQAPPPPSSRRSGVPRDLEIICLTCLAKQPGQRYTSAEALAEDLRAFLEGRPIAAPATEASERVLARAGRRPFVTACGMVAIGLGVGLCWYNLLAGTVAAVLCLFLVGGWFNARLRAGLRESRDRRRHAERNVERLHTSLEMACRLMTAHDLDGLLRLLCETATTLVRADFATVYLIDRERGELQSKVILDERVKEIRLPLGVGIAGRVAVTGETINLADAYADSHFYPDIDRKSGRRTRSLLTFALTGRDGRVLGVFQVMNKRAGAFSREDIELLTFLKRAAGVAIERANDPGGATGPSAA